MNLQICFMNETVSDSDSPNSDNESTTITTPAAPNNNNAKLTSRAPPYHKSPPTVGNNTRNSRQLNGQRPLSLPISQPAAQPPLTTQSTQSLTDSVNEADFFARQARLQIEARMALAQAKEMAHMQMEVCNKILTFFWYLIKENLIFFLSFQNRRSFFCHNMTSLVYYENNQN